jgi:hypothetical protein
MLGATRPPPQAGSSPRPATGAHRPLPAGSPPPRAVSSRDGEGDGQRGDASNNLRFFLHRRPEQGPAERIASTSLSSPSFPLSGDGCPLPKICSAQIPVPPATTTVDEAQSRPAASETSAASVYLGEAPPPLSGDRERRFCLPPATTMVAKHPKFRSSL